MAINIFMLVNLLGSHSTQSNYQNHFFQVKILVNLFKNDLFIYLRPVGFQHMTIFLTLKCWNDRYGMTAFLKSPLRTLNSGRGGVSDIFARPRDPFPFSYWVTPPILDVRVCAWSYGILLCCVQLLSLGGLLFSEQKQKRRGEVRVVN